MINDYDWVAHRERRIKTKIAVSSFNNMLKHRMKKYNSKGLNYSMIEMLEYMQSVGRINSKHFHEQYNHDSYCDCSFCCNTSNVPAYVYLKSYKLNILCFEVLKLKRRGINTSNLRAKAQNKRMKSMENELTKGTVIDVDFMVMSGY